MAKPIYKFFLGKPTEAWYKLSPEEQDALMAKGQEALEKAGGESIVTCDTRWSSEQWLGCGVEKFPDIEAVQKLSELHNELDWLRYIDSVTVLGTEWELS